MTPIARLAAISFAAMLVACTQKAASPPASDSSPPAAVTPPAAEAPATPAEGADDKMFACASDDECVVMEMGCCDHCNGGWRLSVNKTHGEAASTKYHDKDCSGACTERGCDWATAPVCHQGACAMTEDRSGSGKREVFVNQLPAAKP
jgi:hypothetical protein